MSQTVIKLENIGKQYRLGLVGSGTLRDDLRGMWYRFRGKEDPTLKIGEENRLNTTQGEYVWALRDINLEVQKGEILGIIGKNGAGKSTLLKLLSRVTSPTTGQIKVRGRIASLLEVGTGFHGELTGRENIFLNGAILGMKKTEIKAKFDEIVDFAGVGKYIDTPVKRYSSGMYVRLAFAVAAHLEPDILIVDEVLAVGDAEFQKKAIGKMQDISSGGGGRTVLFVSHNMDNIQKLTSRCIVLKNGGIDFIGDSELAIDKYITQNATVLEPIINLSKRKRYGNFGKIVKLETIESVDHTKPFIYKIYEQINFKLLIKFTSNINLPLRIGITIKNFNNISLLSSTTNYIKTNNKIGFIELILSLNDLNLASGFYKLSISIGNGQLNEERIELDVIQDAVDFEIVNTGNSSDIMSNWQKSYGYFFHNNSKIKIIQ